MTRPTVTLDDIRRAVEGPGALVAPVTTELAPRSRAATVLATAWQEASEAESAALASIKLSDLAARCRSNGDSMYYI